jgi:hypothetical protein
MMSRFRRLIASLLVVSTAKLSAPMPAQAGIVATDAALAAGKREHVLSILERSEVRSQLQALGVSPDHVKARVDAMSDDEVMQLAGQIDSLPAGGVDILGAILIVFLVLLITDILGLTKIFPFTRPVR